MSESAINAPKGLLRLIILDTASKNPVSGAEISKHIKLISNSIQRIDLQQSLTQRENQLNVALETSNQGAWEIDINFNTILLTEQWMSLMGYTKESAPKSIDAFEDLIHPDDRKRFKNDFGDQGEMTFDQIEKFKSTGLYLVSQTSFNSGFLIRYGFRYDINNIGIEKDNKNIY